MASKLRSGNLDRLIVLQKRVTTRDEFGEQVITWTEFATRWASSMPVKDGERFGNDEAIATITNRFQILWDATAWADIDPTCRVVFEGRNYDVVAVKEIGRRDGIEISATARAEND